MELDVPAKKCFEVLAAVELYPDWFDVVSHVEVLEKERNGTPGLARAELYVPQSPFGTHFELIVSVRTERPATVMLTRVPDGAADPDRLELTWRVRGARSTELVPGFIPVGGAGEAIAQAAIDAARDALASGSPRATWPAWPRTRSSDAAIM